MTPVTDGFNLRRNPGFRNPPVLPPFISFSEPAAETSRSARAYDGKGDRHWTLRFRRPPTEIWRTHPHEDRPVEQQRHPPQSDEDRKPVDGHGIVDRDGDLSSHLDADGERFGDVLRSRNRAPAPFESVVSPECDGSRHRAGEGEKGVPGDALGEVILGPLAMDSGEQHLGDGNEEGGENLEEEWVMSPEWAEHFHNSPSVQRYLQRLQGSQGKTKSGGTSKRGSNTKGPKGNQKCSARKGAAPNNSGGKNIVEEKSRDAASSGVAAAGTSAGGRAVEGEGGAKAADDAKETELELAKIRARALLYAEKQQDRNLEDAVVAK